MTKRRTGELFFRVGSTDDHARFASQFARTLTPLQHLQAAEEMRRALLYPDGNHAEFPARIG